MTQKYKVIKTINDGVVIEEIKEGGMNNTSAHARTAEAAEYFMKTKFDLLNTGDVLMIEVEGIRAADVKK